MGKHVVHSIGLAWGIVPIVASAEAPSRLSRQKITSATDYQCSAYILHSESGQFFVVRPIAVVTFDSLSLHQRAVVGV